ncbi:C40 family peptidase [Leucobacter viscericola]|uniref:C40 family peptidase n=1 Tax=Leucobacter viscericola TaxID=2714935 RepID=A0A6G7XEU0_9MICO|nr:NlpC/P60 family protein [Leucobacter viscericola]QIK62959.1 C40 family peptidase [Leucobacter viscericola]
MKAKRIVQMAGAAALSLGMVGTFALPAYATAPAVDGIPDGFAAAQTLQTVDVDETILPLSTPDGAVDSAILKEEREQKEAADAAKAAQAAQQASVTKAASSYTGKDVPAGVGASGIVTAALAQLGEFQDCTALVERSLRAIGVPAGDLGTQIGEYTGLGGSLITDGAYAPGDVLIWSGRHVAVYIGNGQAVHGGFGGNQTVVASAFIDGAPDGVVRFG